MEYKNYYHILGVDKTADGKDIKQAYRRLARQYHPDKNPGSKQAEEKFKAINEAYEVIGNPDNRAKYDQLGSNYHRFQQMGGQASDFDFSQWFAQGAGRQSSNVDFGDIFGGKNNDFSSFFNSIFGAAGSPRPRPQNPYQTNQPPNYDIEQVVEITLEEASSGATRTYQQNGRQFTAKIPAGAKTGSKIRLRGKGHSHSQGVGDLFLVVQVLPHETFERVGHHLEVAVEVDVVTAVLGGQVTVPTLGGSVTLKIPPGSQNGQLFRLGGKGLPHLGQPERFGDLLAKIRVYIPQQLTKEEPTLYERLAQLAQPRP